VHERNVSGKKNIMAIDQYEHDFQYLTKTDIPEFMRILDFSIANPISMDDFSIKGVEVAGLCRQLGLESDFPGCYVLLDQERPIYVGISKNILQRLRQHVQGTTHFDASLAYRIASHKMPHQHTRSQAMEQDAFKPEFDATKSYLRGLNVAFVKIINPLALYVFEPYCAMRYDTSKWNTFETH
jgi:GIY-YIG catalytic domain